MEVAIVVVAYNRCDSLQRLLLSLEKAFYDKPVTLIISVDKSDTDAVERFSENYIWPYGDKIIDKHKKNLGLRNHMMSLGKWFDHFDAIAVLEDDIVVSPNYYTYTCQTVKKYHTCSEIAGISLYGFNVNYQSGIPFRPVNDEHDVYFMNCAMSWGEVWMRDSWQKFYDWYLQHQDFPMLPELPYCICSWNQKSWLKYHTRYCIEENKYFVHPYVSLTTNFGDAGEHSKGTANTVHQVELQQGEKKNYELPVFGDKAVYYDGFFENKSLYQVLELDTDNLCLDLNGEWKNRLNKRYWLTTEIKDFKIVKSFGLNYRPIEVNVILNNPGQNIFLYDTYHKEKNPVKNTHSTMLYHHYLSNIFYFIRQYGYVNTWKDFVSAIRIKYRTK